MAFIINMGGIMKQITILMKPSSGSCNAVCSYCFYEDVMNHRKHRHHRFMKADTVDAVLKKTLESEEYNRVLYYFQGGEPLVVGINYYKEFISKVKLMQKDKVVEYAIQTNGLLLNDEYCKLFKENNFLVGVSLDGIKKTNNYYRFLADKKTGSFESVISKIELLKKYDISYNILTVLSKKLSQHVQEIFAFYKKKQFEYVQYIPCLSSLDDNEDDTYSCTPEIYGSFYKELFMYWFKDLKKGNYISIRLFEDILLIFNGKRPIQCGMLGNCEKQCIVESNGTVYPCDFYVLDEYNLGNIKEKEIADMMQDKKIEIFLNIDNDDHSLLCKNCKYQKVCNGGCKRQRKTFLNDTYCGQKEIFHLFYSNMKEIQNCLNAIAFNERGNQ